jgi:hypothetical protein
LLYHPRVENPSQYPVALKALYHLAFRQQDE